MKIGQNNKVETPVAVRDKLGQVRVAGSGPMLALACEVGNTSQ